MTVKPWQNYFSNHLLSPQRETREIKAKVLYKNCFNWLYFSRNQVRCYVIKRQALLKKVHFHYMEIHAIVIFSCTGHLTETKRRPLLLLPSYYSTFLRLSLLSGYLFYVHCLYMSLSQLRIFYFNAPRQGSIRWCSATDFS